jgi:glycosyltransferase involved in cell wall biosynthesis
MMGGGQWSLYYLVKYLNKELFRPVVLCPEEGDFAERVRSAGAEAIFFDVGRMRNMNLCKVRQIASIIRDRRISIVHTDSTTETLYAGIAARLTHVPLVWHIRATDRERLLDRLLSSIATRLILVANILEPKFGWLQESHKLSIIHNGVALGEFDASPAIPSLREEFGIDTDTALIGCVGRISEGKGQEYLIQAMRTVERANLILIGGGDKDYMRKIEGLCEESGMTSRTIFTGYREDIYRIVKCLDIAVSPTLEEAFSRVILESMAAGKPVIATDVGGNPEAVQDGITGYLVPPRDPSALCARINELVNNKEKREKMGLAGRKRVEQCFTIEQHVRSVELLYEDMLSKIITG